MSANPEELVAKLRACIGDPMWADHAEVPKTWLRAWLAEIIHLRSEIERLSKWSGVRVRELEWQGENLDTRWAVTPLGGYRAEKLRGKNGWIWFGPMGDWVEAFTEDAAKAAAQADFDKGIRSALEAPEAAPSFPEKPTPAMRIAYDELCNSLGLDKFANLNLVWETILEHLPQPAPSVREVEDATYWKGAYERTAARNIALSNALTLAVQTLDDLASGTGLSRPIEQIIRDLNECASSGGAILSSPSTAHGAAEALREAAERFDEIRRILIKHLDEPERTAFWKAVNGREFCRAALAQPAAQEADGWKMVPISPTQDMLDAGYYPAVQRRGAKSVWAEMLAASPAREG